MTGIPASSSGVPAGRDAIPVIVHGLGYRVSHVATVPVADLRSYTWWTSGRDPFTGVPVPVIAACGRRVSSRGPIVVVLPRGFLVRCAGCRKEYGQSPELSAPVPAMRPERIEWRGEYEWLPAEEADDGGF